MLLDSNIIIYAARPEHDDLRRFIATHAPAVSGVSYVEVLGFHKLTAEDRQLFEEFFAAATILPISDAVLQQAVSLRQRKKMSLGDALVGATSLVYTRTLVTRNVDDFKWIPEIKLHNPFATNP